MEERQHAAVLQVLDSYAAAAWAKDLEAFMALQDEQVLVFDMGDSWSCSGIVAWREMTAG